MFNYIRLGRLAKDKHSSLLGPFVSYKENEVVLIRLERQYPISLNTGYFIPPMNKAVQ